MEKIIIEPVWFDSLGAKSSCTLVETPDVKILIDPGIVAMQPSFPASDAKKRQWWETNLESLMKTKGRRKKYLDPLADLPIARHKDFGDYNKRRAELGTAEFFSEIAKSLNFTAEHTENAEAP